MKSRRMTAEKRREAILAAVAPLFAGAGLNGVTTRQLAEAAGVSEALLFRHFPDKHELYAAASSRTLAPAEALDLVPANFPPSTRRLVVTIQRLAEHLLDPKSQQASRCLSQSLLGDGQLARRYLATLAEALLPSLRADLNAARACGDLFPAPSEDTEFWLMHHLFWGLQQHALPARSPLDYHCARFDLLQRGVRFALRGLGLREEAIERDLHLRQLEA